jgi:O-antigen ligase
VSHYNHGFSEEAGHWVMWPFFKDHTSYGAILAITIPMVVFLLFETKRLSLKYLLIFILSFLLIALYFSYTRAAWLSIIGALLIYLLYYYKIKLKWLISFGLISFIFIVLNFNNLSYLAEKNDAEHTTENFSERIESMSNISSDASNLERLNRWSCAIKLFQEKPLFGWGPGTYSFVYAPFQSSNDLTIISTNFGDGGNAHSEYLGPLAEQGAIGMLIMIFLVGIIFYYSGVFYLKNSDSFQGKLTMMIILSLSTYFSHGILNNYLDTDKASVPVWGLTAIFVAISTYNVSKNKFTERIKSK